MLKHLNGTGKHALVVLSLLTLLFWAGPSWAGQAGKTTQLTNDEVKNLITNAKTAADHQRLAQYYAAEAKAFEAEAKVHTDLATQYRQTPNPNETKHPGIPGTYTHCYNIAAGLRSAAQSAQQLSADHAEMAKNAPN